MIRARILIRPLVPIALAIGMQFPGTAQMLSVIPTVEDPTQLHFDPAFIQRNGIISITGRKLVKRDNEPMREQKEVHLFRFDAQGRMMYSNNSYGRPGSGRDTASVTFAFDGHGAVVREAHNDLNGHFTFDLQRDTAGRVVRKTYSRIENLSNDRYALVPGLRTEISDERYSHQVLNDTARRITHLNNIGLPWREQTWSRDRWGYLRAIEDRYLVSGRYGRITFRYDEKGRLAERIEQPDLASAATTKHTWRYDPAGNVTLCDAWRDEAQVSHEEYVYEEGSMLLKATVRKQFDTGLIHIVRYTTERR